MDTPSSHANQKVIVGLSGGVDSSVAAYLLIKQGYQVEGLFMKNWEDDDTLDYCSSEQDLKDVRQVCKRLNIPLHTVNFAYEYWQRVFSHFLEEYQAGRTPNPDILCNREIKFKEFLNHALNLGADYIATGHYAAIHSSNEGFNLLEAADTNKDQTYFLYTLGQSQLAKTLFPLAHLSKPEIRAIALDLDLVTHNKKDSTGICFIGERPFNDFLNDYLVGKPGLIQTPEGHTLGEHPGLIYYTLGQRRGLYIGGQKETHNAPWYVVAKDTTTQTLVVSQNRRHPLNLTKTIWTEKPSWTNIEYTTGETFTASAKVRYRQSKCACRVSVEPHQLRVEFETPLEAVTPGQALVLYQNTVCLGGATIDKTDSLGGLNFTMPHAKAGICHEQHTTD